MVGIYALNQLPTYQPIHHPMLIETWRFGRFITDRQRREIAQAWGLDPRPLSQWYALGYEGPEDMRPGRVGERVEQVVSLLELWGRRDVASILEGVKRPVGYRCPDCIIVHPGALLEVMKEAGARYVRNMLKPPAG